MQFITPSRFEKRAEIFKRSRDFFKISFCCILLILLFPDGSPVRTERRIVESVTAKATGISQDFVIIISHLEDMSFETLKFGAGVKNLSSTIPFKTKCAHHHHRHYQPYKLSLACCATRFYNVEINKMLSSCLPVLELLK